MLEAKELCFHYRRKFELKSVSFSLEEGYLMCLVGRNGAGKTTLLELLYGIRMPEKGTVSFCGETVIKGDRSSAHAGRMVSYHGAAAFIQNDLWCAEKLTVDENVSLLKCLYDRFDMQEFERILRRFEFAESDRKIAYHELSTGRRMQFQIAFHMARHARLILMDEPLANLDPIAKEDILELIREKIDRERVSVILSTHLVEEVTDMADYIGIMEGGRLAAFGDRETVFTAYGTDNLRGLFGVDSAKEGT